MKKSITILLITILSLLSSQQSYANIAEGRKATFIWYITDAGQLVLAPDDGTYENLQQGEYKVYKEDIKSAKVEAGVTPTTCRDMFYDLYNMETIDISGLNTENVTNMVGMFADCSSLTSLDVSSLNTQNVTDMSNMFRSCSSLTSLDLSNFNTQNVTDMTAMFFDCSSLLSLDLSNFNTAKVTDMGYLFYYCPSLASLDLSSFDTKNVTSMSNMFYDCSSLISLDLSNFDTQNVRNMSGMFGECSSLTSLDLSNFNTENVTDMNGMFAYCSSLASLDLSNFNTQNVTDMGGMFDGCSSLTTIISNCEIPSPLKVGTFDSFDNRFNCKLVVPEGTMELYAAADGWNELGWIDDGSSENSAQGKTGTCIWYITNEGELVIAPADGVSGDLPEWGYFYDVPWGEYSEIIFSTKIMPGVNAKSCRLMFTGLGKMTSADLSGLNTDNLTDMQAMFQGCSSLTSLDLSNFNTAKVTDMGYLFFYCSSLTSLDLSSFDTKNVTSMNTMFYYCSSLTSLDLSNFNTENVTDMSHMFNGCSALTSLDLSNFNTQNVTSMSAMFHGCPFTTLDLSNFNTENVTDMSWMFNWCNSLEELNLTGFNMQNVTNVENMFGACVSLTTIISNNETPSPLKVGTFSESFENRANCTLLVPAGTKALYRAAYGWNELGKIDDGTPDYPDGTLVLNLTSDEPFYNSEDYKADVVTYTRNFSKETQKQTSAGWETIVLPFNVQNVITEDGKVLAPFGSTLAQTGAALPFWLAELKDGQFVAATSIRANVPYIISMPNGDDIYSKNRISGNVIFFAHNATVYASNGTQIMQGADGFAFVPTYDFVEADDYVYAINDEVFSDGAVDYLPGSVFVHYSRMVRPFEAYMQFNQDYGFAPRFLPVMADETDGIVTITPDTDKVSIYDLSGRKIDTMRKGVNIVKMNGRAVRVMKK